MRSKAHLENNEYDVNPNDSHGSLFEYFHDESSTSVVEVGPVDFTDLFVSLLTIRCFCLVVCGAAGYGNVGREVVGHGTVSVVFRAEDTAAMELK